MNRSQIAVTTASMVMPVLVYAANPFLEAKDDKPVSATFRGTEWGDEIGQDEIPLTARVVTTRLAKMPWGAIFNIEFLDLKSSAQTYRDNSIAVNWREVFGNFDPLCDSCSS